MQTILKQSQTTAQWQNSQFIQARQIIQHVKTGKIGYVYDRPWNIPECVDVMFVYPTKKDMPDRLPYSLVKEISLIEAIEQVGHDFTQNLDCSSDGNFYVGRRFRYTGKAKELIKQFGDQALEVTADDGAYATVKSNQGKYYTWFPIHNAMEV